MSSCACAPKDAKIRELQAALVALTKQKRYEDAVPKMRNAKGKRTELGGQQAAVDNERDLLSSKPERAGVPVALFNELKSELASLAEERKEEATQLAALQSRFQELSGVYNAVQSEKKAHATELEALQKRVQDLLAAHRAVESEKKAQAAELAALQTRFQDLSSAHSALESEKNDKAIEIASLQERVQELNASHASLAVENNTYPSRPQESVAGDELTAMLALDRLLMNNGPTSTPEAKTAFLEQEVVDSRIIRAQLATLQAEYQNCASHLRDSERKNWAVTDSLRHVEAQLSSLRKDNERLRQRLARYNSDEPQSEVVPESPQSQIPTQCPTENLLAQPQARENDQPLQWETASAPLLTHTDLGVPRDQFTASFFTQASVNMLASSPEPVRCRMWQDVVLVPRAGYMLNQQALYDTYLQDCQRPGYTPPVDFYTFFSVIRYDVIGARLQQFDGGYYICGVVMRTISEPTPPETAGIAPPRPHAFPNFEATPMHGVPANRTDMTPMAVAVTSPLIIPTGSQHSSSQIFETSSIRNDDSNGIPTKRHEIHDEMDDPFAKRPRVSSVAAPPTSLATLPSPPPVSLSTATGFT